MIRQPYVGVSLLIFASVSTVLGGNTTCSGNQLDWYTSVVGETPCTTYQRLRQICNNQVPVFRPNTPGDNCDDQLQPCCCNSISWALSMLCMNCQILQEPNGIDAGATAYTLYRSNSDGNLCSPGTNMTLPVDIQAAVCNANIRLDNFLYELFWNTGDWFYEYYSSPLGVSAHKYAVEKHVANNNNTFTHCADQISPSATPTPPPSNSSANQMSPFATPTPPPSNSSANLPVMGTSHPPTSNGLASNTPSANERSAISRAAIGGGIGGGLFLLGLLCTVLWFFCRRRNANPLPNQEYTGLSTTMPPLVDQGGTVVTPYIVSDYGTSGVSFESRRPGTQSRSKRQNPSISKTALSAPSSSPQMATSGTPSSSASDSGPATSSRSRSEASPERHEDGGSIMVALERSGSGRLPPAYMSWNPNGQSRQSVAPAIAARSTDILLNSYPTTDRP